MATAQLAQFETGHADMVHDAQFDYYGRRLATCSSDRSIKVFDVAGDQVRRRRRGGVAAASSEEPPPAAPHAHLRARSRRRSGCQHFIRSPAAAAARR